MAKRLRKSPSAIVVFVLHYSEWLGRKVSPTGMRAISKIISMLLAAIAISMIRRGWYA